MSAKPSRMDAPPTPPRRPRYDGTPKRCPLCGQDKPRDADSWYPLATGLSADGLRYYCAECWKMIAVVNDYLRQARSGDAAYLRRLVAKHRRTIALIELVLADPGLGSITLLRRHHDAERKGKR